jgi:hypothetical protein
MGEQRHGAARKPSTDHQGQNVGAAFASIRHGLSEHPELQLGDELERHRRLHLCSHWTDPEPIGREPGAADKYVFYDGIHHTGDLWDFGPSFDKGIVSISPPILLGTPYQIFVSKTNSDGNDIAGVRVPSVTVPIANYTGWAQRAGSNSDPDPSGATSMVDGCDATGQYIPFPDTKAHRIATGDPRPSVQERYGNAAGTNADYVKAVTDAANALVSQHFLLPEDVATYVTPATLMVIPANP